MKTWVDFVNSVRDCSICRSYPKTKKNSKPWNGTFLEEPTNSRRGLLFISEAPPGGTSTSYFLNGPNKDGLRKRFFFALSLTKEVPQLKTIDDFLREGCYLLPSFSYPCSKASGGNTNPTIEMAWHSGETHLKTAIDYLRPRVVVLLGTRALAAGIAMELVPDKGRPYSVGRYRKITAYISRRNSCEISTFVTYWPSQRIGKDRYHSWLVPTLEAAFKSLRS